MNEMFILKDYETTLQLMRQFVGEDKIQEYEDNLEQDFDRQKDSIYS